MHMPHHSLDYRNYLQTLRGRLVASFAIRDFAIGSSGIYISLYLYNFGYSLDFIAGYYLLYFGLCFLAHHLAAKIIEHYGLYHSMFLSYLGLGLTYVLLSWSRDNTWLLYATLIPMVASSVFYWPARHIDIARVFDSGQRMQHTTSVINSLATFISTIAPLFGGLLAARFGPPAALASAFTAMALATWLLFKEYESERGEPIRTTFDPRFKRSMLANAAKNFDGVISTVAWPLFIYVALTDFSVVGVILAITAAVSILVTYSSGNWFMRFPYFWSGMVIRVISYPIRVVLTTGGGLLSAGLTASLGSALMDSRYSARYYNEAQRSGDIDSYVFSMEKAGDLGKAVVWLIVLLSLQLGASDKAALIAVFVAAVAVLPLSSLLGASRHPD